MLSQIHKLSEGWCVETVNRYAITIRNKFLKQEFEDFNRLQNISHKNKKKRLKKKKVIMLYNFSDFQISDN